MSDYRESVEGWRYDYLTPEGLLQPFIHRGDLPTWATTRSAACAACEHHAPPVAECVCGVCACEQLSETLALTLDLLAHLCRQAERKYAAPGVFAVSLSRVTVHDVLPVNSRYTDGDPPGSIRGSHLEYEHVLTDRPRFTTTPAGWPPVKHVGDLGAWVRGQIKEKKS